MSLTEKPTEAKSVGQPGYREPASQLWCLIRKASAIADIRLLTHLLRTGLKPAWPEGDPP